MVTGSLSPQILSHQSTVFWDKRPGTFTKRFLSNWLLLFPNTSCPSDPFVKPSRIAEKRLLGLG